MITFPDLVDIAEIAAALRRARARYGTPRGRSACREHVRAVARQLERDIDAVRKARRKRGKKS
jgi:hypothetical protein